MQNFIMSKEYKAVIEELASNNELLTINEVRNLLIIDKTIQIEVKKGGILSSETKQDIDKGLLTAVFYTFDDLDRIEKDIHDYKLFVYECLNVYKTKNLKYKEQETA